MHQMPPNISKSSKFSRGSMPPDPPPPTSFRQRSNLYILLTCAVLAFAPYMLKPFRTNMFKIIPGSRFIPWCFMPRFKIIGFLVLKKILKVFAIYSPGSHLGHVTWTIYTNFRSPFLRMPHMKFGFDWQSDFRGEDIRNCWRTDDGWTSEHGHPKLTFWAFGSGELKSMWIA